MKKATKKPVKTAEIAVISNIFKDKVLFICQDIGTTLEDVKPNFRRILHDKFIQHGGKVITNSTLVSNQVTHIVSRFNKSSLEKFDLRKKVGDRVLTLASRDAVYVDMDWIGNCVITQRLLEGEVTVQTSSSNKNPNLKRKASPVEKSSDDEPISPVSIHESLSDPNKRIINLLQEVADKYSTSNSREIKFKIDSYNDVIKIIENYPGRITSLNQVKGIKGISATFQAKISEILTTGNLRQASQSPQEKSLLLFMKIYGVGTEAAHEFYSKGYRTLKDLEENKNDLNTDQKLGLLYYQDLNKKMTRPQVEGVFQIVAKAVEKVDSSLLVEAVGSFRRKSELCGDVDILVKDSNSTENVLEKIVIELKKLMVVYELVNPDGVAFRCICLDPNDHVHRRLDIFICSKENYGASLILWTGDTRFNRSLKVKAKSLGMKFEFDGLYELTAGDARGRWIAGETEEQVFQALGVDSQEPGSRFFKRVYM